MMKTLGVRDVTLAAIGVATAGVVAVGVAGLAQAADSKVALGAVGNTLAYDKSALSAVESEVEVEFTNGSAIPHDVRVSSSGVDLGGTPVISNDVASTTLSLDAGSYSFFCSVGGHRAAGMEGTLTVTEASAPAPADPEPTQPADLTPVAPSLDLSAAAKQRVKKLKAKVLSDADADLAISGKAKVPAKGGKKTFRLKQSSVELDAGVAATVKPKFEQHNKSVKKIAKLLKRDGKARRGATATIELVAANEGGSSGTEKLRVKLKR